MNGGALAIAVVAALATPPQPPHALEAYATARSYGPGHVATR